MPISSPLCVPRAVQCVATQSASPAIRSIRISIPLNAEWYRSTSWRKPSGPWNSPSVGLEPTKSGAISSSITSSLPFVHTSSAMRRSIAFAPSAAERIFSTS